MVTVLVPGSPVVADGRPAAVPARDRHALRGRARGRDRRLSTVRARRAVDELRRAGFSEHSTGNSRPHGHITKTSSRHARWLLTEAAWHYRRPPRLGTTLERRQEGQDPLVVAIAWKAQQRLHHLWRRLDLKRGKRKTIVAVAVARYTVRAGVAIAANPMRGEPLDTMLVERPADRLGPSD